MSPRRRVHLRYGQPHGHPLQTGRLRHRGPNQHPGTGPGSHHGATRLRPHSQPVGYRPQPWRILRWGRRSCRLGHGPGSQRERRGRIDPYPGGHVRTGRSQAFSWAGLHGTQPGGVGRVGATRRVPHGARRRGHPRRHRHPVPWGWGDRPRPRSPLRHSGWLRDRSAHHRSVVRQPPGRRAPGLRGRRPPHRRPVSRPRSRGHRFSPQSAQRRGLDGRLERGLRNQLGGGSRVKRRSPRGTPGPRVDC